MMMLMAVTRLFVTVTVLAVAALTVSPKETSPSASVGPHERITRSFRICNTGNVPNSYLITQADVNAPDQPRPVRLAQVRRDHSDDEERLQTFAEGDQQ